MQSDITMQDIITSGFDMG